MTMNLRTVRLVSVLGNAFDFTLNKTMASAKYTLKSVEGAGPPEYSVNMARRSGDGSVFSSRRASGRRLVLNVGFQPNYSLGETVGSLRQALYELADSRQGAPITVQFRDSATPVAVYQTLGYVSRIEPNIFSKESEMQITIECADPYFSAPSATTIDTPSIAGLSVTNPGDVECGFYFRWIANANHNDFEIRRITPWPFNFKIIYPFQINDTVEFNTRVGIRYVQVTRAGTKINLLRYLAVGSDFVPLYPGVNAFSYVGTATNVKTITVQFTPKYLGV